MSGLGFLFGSERPPVFLSIWLSPFHPLSQALFEVERRHVFNLTSLTVFSLARNSLRSRWYNCPRRSPCAICFRPPPAFTCRFLFSGLLFFSSLVDYFFFFSLWPLCLRSPSLTSTSLLSQSGTFFPQLSGLVFFLGVQFSYFEGLASGDFNVD